MQSLARGDFSGAWEESGGSLIRGVVNAATGGGGGACVNLSLGFGHGFSGSMCLLAVENPDSRTEYGIAFSYGGTDPTFGGDVSVGLIRSNADTVAQFSGHSAGVKKQQEHTDWLSQEVLITLSISTQRMGLSPRRIQGASLSARLD
ncbi:MULTISPECIES: hypothetical protein [Streptomyces]|uniref:hypothetical protein n=1 Tax=Streptomyces TaxID=1883 RepID=UPI001D0539EF|nr:MULTISPECIES: hypothetical protein [Streptomyces]